MTLPRMVPSHPCQSFAKGQQLATAIPQSELQPHTDASPPVLLKAPLSLPAARGHHTLTRTVPAPERPGQGHCWAGQALPQFMLPGKVDRGHSRVGRGTRGKQLMRMDIDSGATGVSA